MDQEKLEVALMIGLNAVCSAMWEVARAQGGVPSGVEIKPDGTYVTATDRLAAEAAASQLCAIGLPIVSEDGQHDECSGRFCVFFDSLDGTGAFKISMMTSTVMFGIYDLQEHRLIASIVGEPVSGRMWITMRESGTWLFWHGTCTPVKVSPNTLSKKETVLMDVSHGFTRAGRPILTDGQVARLFANLNSQVKILIPGSNGGNQALVANGGPIGSITTALGGPWDAMGVQLVINAGGCARAFSVNHGVLTEKHPLAVGVYDIMITANCPETLEELVAQLELAM